jgi:hypothetical protein
MSFNVIVTRIADKVIGPYPDASSRLEKLTGISYNCRKDRIPVRPVSGESVTGRLTTDRH